MKQTLYQILGVETDASFEEIEIAYRQRFDELSVATIQDPNKLVVLNEARDILSDAGRRMGYDASLARPVAAVPAGADEPEAPGPLQVWRNWIIAGVVLATAALAWSNRDSTEPAPSPPPATTVADSDEASAAAGPSGDGTETDTPAEAPAAAADPAPADEPQEPPIVARWSCFDPVLGRNSRYDFQAGGTLEIDSPDAPLRSFGYRVAGNTVTLSEGGVTSTLLIEQMSARRLVLNSGGEGRRLVCNR
jgi:curved DNA-binding protein CbpA